MSMASNGQAQPADTTFGWQVTSSMPRVQADPVSGTPVSGYRVNFTLSDGTAHNIFVPDSLYTMDSVKALVGQAARNIWDISHLTSAQQ